MVVNTCGFVEAAKKDSVDTLLAAADLKENGRTRAVVAVGCMAERYGTELAEAMPEADAVLGFDDYADVAGRLRSVLAGERHRGPRAARPAPAAAAGPGRATGGGGARRGGPGPRSGQRPPDRCAAGWPAGRRRRSRSRPAATGAARSAPFPTFRGAYVSRPLADVVAEARWLAAEGVRELFLVSENTTSYGKDLGDLRLLEQLLTQLSGVDGLDWIRVSYLQPAEMRPSLVAAMTGTDKVVPVLRPVLPARRPGRAAADAPVR